MAQINNNNGGNMPLEVHYVNDKSWNPETKNFSDPAIRKEADDIGHLLMMIGVSVIAYTRSSGATRCRTILSACGRVPP